MLIGKVLGTCGEWTATIKEVWHFDFIDWNFRVEKY